MKNGSKVVIDTNVFISALVFGGTPRRVTDLIGTEVITPVVSEEIMTEVRRIIRAKFPAFLQYERQLEALLQSEGLWVQLGAANVRVCRDPDDDKFIETALIGNCDYIISGDNDLLAISTYQHIRILRPAAFLELV